MMTELWLVVCGVGALLLRAGLAIHQTGLVRSKNSAGAALRNLADACVAILIFWLLGAAILRGDRHQLAAGALAGPAAMKFPGTIFFYLCAALLGPGIAVGITSERSRFFPMLSVTVLMAGLVIPLAGHWAWASGWLARMGFHDLAGASVIHVAGGLCGAAGAVIVGARAGKFNRDGSSNGIPGHSAPLSSLGIMLMVVGWIPYVVGFVVANGQSQLATAVAMNVLLSAAAGGLASMLVCQARYGKLDVHLIYGGVLGALVAISAGADVTSGLGALVIGAVAGLLVPVATLTIDLAWRIDDASNGIAVHVIGGIWGTLAAGLFGSGLSIAQRAKSLGIQALGLIVIIALALALSTALLAALKATIGLRSKEADEYDGLDLAEHDIGAYPDFQQTMIKSYHLREA